MVRPAGGPVALATCVSIPEVDHDAELLVAALAAAGVEARWLAWDDPGVDWADERVVVIRSTWNYYRHLEAFLAWAEAVARSSRLLNPIEVVRWNVRKRYLGELARRGVRAVPTVYVPRSDRAPSLAGLMDEQGWPRAVIKPEVSAASSDTHLVHRDAVDEELFSRLVGEREMMVQPYVASVEGYGERAVVWVDGALTHAVRKSPRLAGGTEAVSEALPIADDERAHALAALATVDVGLLYARVDLARDETGAPMVMELELVEPSLFLLACPEAAEALARAIARAGNAAPPPRVDPGGSRGECG